VPVISAKGGSGKTMLAANLAWQMAEAGRRVLAIDLDPQNALRFHLGTGPAHDAFGLTVAARGDCTWAQAVQPARGGVVLLPYGPTDDVQQIAFEQQLAQQPLWLSGALQALRLPAEAIVVIDTPPGPSVYVQQVLRIAHVALMALLSDAGSFATRAIMERMLDTYARGRAAYVGTGYVVNQVDVGKRLNRDVLASFRHQLGGDLLGVVHLDQAVGEALAATLPVARYAPHSQAAHDLAACARRTLARLQDARAL